MVSALRVPAAFPPSKCSWVPARAGTGRERINKRKKKAEQTKKKVGPSAVALRHHPNSTNPTFVAGVEHFPRYAYNPVKRPGGICVCDVVMYTPQGVVIPSPSLSLSQSVEMYTPKGGGGTD